MTQPVIEPRSPGLLANTLLIRPMTWYNEEKEINEIHLNMKEKERNGKGK